MSRDDGYFDVADFGPVGTKNDTATIAAAVAAAKATITTWGSKGLYFPPGTNYTVTSPIDFRGISNVRCDGWLLWWGPLKPTGHPSASDSLTRPALVDTSSTASTT